MTTTDVETQIEQIFQRFRRTENFSREYFQRFTQLLSQTIEFDENYRLVIENFLISNSFPFDQTNISTFEFQLRLIRYFLREKIFRIENVFLRDIFQHEFLRTSSLLRHLTLEIALLVPSNQIETFDDEFFVEILRNFSSDENLYVRRNFGVFCSKFLPKKFYVELKKSDLIFEILLHRPPTEQKEFLDEFQLLNISNVDSPAIRRFVLEIGRFLVDESPLIVYLNRLIGRSCRDFVFCLLTLIFSRVDRQNSIEHLTGCLHAVFLFMQDEQIDEISTENVEEEQNSMIVDQCEIFLDFQIEPNVLASIVIDCLQIYLDDQSEFLSQLDFYSSTIFYMLTKRQIDDEKLFAQLIRCAEILKLSNEFLASIFDKIEAKTRHVDVYRSFFHLISRRDEAKEVLQRIYPLINVLLSTSSDQIHWDQLDCLLTFLINLIDQQTENLHWFTSNFIDELVEKLLDHPNEFVQSNLIRFLSRLVQNEYFSSNDEKFVENFLHFSRFSLADVGRCELAKAWNVLLTKSSQNPNVRFENRKSISDENLKEILRKEIRHLIGDADEQTEIECLKLIEKLGVDSNDEDLIRFFIDDGATKRIQRRARDLFSRQEEKTVDHQHSFQILQEEFASILHWFDHPDEHLVLDCD